MTDIVGLLDAPSTRSVRLVLFPQPARSVRTVRQFRMVLAVCNCEARVLVRQLAAGNAVWVVQVDVAPSHRKRIRWGTLRVEAGYRFGAGHVPEKYHLEKRGWRL